MRHSLLFAPLLSVVALAQGAEPADTVTALHQALEAAAGGDLTWDGRYDLIAPVIRSSHDLGYIGRFTIRRQWRGLNEQQREAFLAAFSSLAINTYVARFGAVKSGAFSYSGEYAVEGERYRVSAFITPADGEPVSLDYVLRAEDGVWKIINVVADGVSDLALKRAEYQRIIGEQGIAGLIDEINAQAARLRE